MRRADAVIRDGGGVRRREHFRAMGCEIIVAGAGVDRVQALFEADDRRFSRFSPQSELAHVNGAGSTVLVSDRFAHAVAAALVAARQTDGLVDPTLLDAIEAAGYDRDFDELPVDAAPPRPGARGRWRDVRLHGRLLSLAEGVRLDLNGVVKSMAVDDALHLLATAGWVSAGGDLATTRPVEVALPGGRAVRLVSGGIATSSSGVRRWVRGGRSQHHLIDPRTGAPAASPWEHVTVCGASCLMADVAAKAAFLLGAAGPDWLDARGMPGRFVRADGVVECNSAWQKALAQREVACT